jgi:hypothetical protein
LREVRWQWIAAVWLISVSLVLYVVHYVIFKDSRHIFLWSLTSLAFLPISVLFVTLIINRLLTDRERRVRLQKMNMVIGAFFSEVGNELLAMLTEWDEDIHALRMLLTIHGDWEEKEYTWSTRKLSTHAYDFSPERLDLALAKEFLSSRRTFLLRLLENPNLLEHEAFTALLRAVLHAAEELDYRESLEGLPEADVKHLAGDFRRVYAVLVRQWFEYIWFIKKAYPYLFSLAIRTNPFDRESSPIVQ